MPLVGGYICGASGRCGLEGPMGWGWWSSLPTEVLLADWLVELQWGNAFMFAIFIPAISLRKHAFWTIISRAALKEFSICLFREILTRY